MISSLYTHIHDLISPDGYIKKIKRLDEKNAIAEVRIENISSMFVGYELPLTSVSFNFKSILAQLGLNGVEKEILLDKKNGIAEILIELRAIGPLAIEMLKFLEEG